MQAWTAQAQQKQRELGDEFYLNCGNYLIVWGYYRPGCYQCDNDEEHIRHATAQDWQFCNDALQWLSERTGREFGFYNGDIYHAGVTPPVTPEQYLETLREMRGGG